MKGIFDKRCVKRIGHLLFLLIGLFLLQLFQLGFLFGRQRKQVSIFGVKNGGDRIQRPLVQVWVHKAEPGVTRQTFQIFDRTNIGFLQIVVRLSSSLLLHTLAHHLILFGPLKVGRGKIYRVEGLPKRKNCRVLQKAGRFFEPTFEIPIFGALILRESACKEAFDIA